MTKKNAASAPALRLALLLALASVAQCFPEPGKWTLRLNSTHEYDGVAKNVFRGTKLNIRVHCTSSDDGGPPKRVKIGWVLREAQCWNEYSYLGSPSLSDALTTYYHKPFYHWDIKGLNSSKVHYAVYEEIEQDCEGVIFLEPQMLNQEVKMNFVQLDRTQPGHDGDEKEEGSPADQVSSSVNGSNNGQYSLSGPKTESPHYVINHEGDYLLVVHMQGTPDGPFKATVEVEMRGEKGYLSVVDYPLLPFYGCMCGVYLVMGVVWLVLCARHWRDLLRIQFWIGGVIFLGMLEKAMFLAEYENVNLTGAPTNALTMAAEITSCAKRTLARMLVVIVSLGFGIVKPRLGPTLHRVLGVGLVYFLTASTEAYLRIMKPKNDVSTTTMIVGIPLAVIDSSICWWVFSALIQTTRTLRLRRNLVKLALYRHFTNTLVFSVLASVLFMLWSIKYHKLEDCLRDWRDIWVDDAFWHLLFSVVLVVIMFLWRPSQNNQRYAFTPLLDYDEDEESEGEDEADPFFKERLTMRMTGKTQQATKESAATSEDPLKWIEENIPQSADADNPLPVLDSDEEIETTRFEINKME